MSHALWEKEKQRARKRENLEGGEDLKEKEEERKSSKLLQERDPDAIMNFLTNYFILYEI